MKAMLFADWMNIRRSMKALLWVFAVMAVSAFAYGGSAFIPFLVTMLSVMGPATLMSTDHAYGWDRLSLTLPVSRRDIVSSKFTVSLALNAALLLLGVVLTMVFSAVHRDGSLAENLLGLLACEAAALLLMGIEFDLILRFGTERGRYFLLGVVWVLQRHGRRVLIQNPPAKPLTTEEMDHVYALPYMRTYHPSYEALGGVPAIQEVQFSIIHNRGCFGACNFCALAFHQGRYIQVRSHESVIEEAKKITQMPGFKGYIHDVGGPTANFRFPACKKQDTHGCCKDKRCLFPSACSNIEADHTDYLNLLRELRRIEGIKKVFVRSGLRYDYMMADRDDAFFKELVEHHISGQLKVAPEHMSDNALYYMGKPSFNVYEQFRERYARINQKLGRKQYLVPYLMSSHPGATLDDAIMLAQYLNRIGYMPEQVQDFYPTPGTLSTAMYYTGIDPRTKKPVYVAKTPEEKAMQRALLQWRRPDKRPIILAALKKAGREDLIGYGKECLIRPNRSGEQNVAPRSSKPAHRHGVSAARPENPRRSGKPAAKPASRAPQPKKGWAKPKKKK